MNQPEIDICSSCGEHTEFICCDDFHKTNEKHDETTCTGDLISYCCSASPYDSGGGYFYEDR